MLNSRWYSRIRAESLACSEQHHATNSAAANPFAVNKALSLLILDPVYPKDKGFSACWRFGFNRKDLDLAAAAHFLDQFPLHFGFTFSLFLYSNETGFLPDRVIHRGLQGTFLRENVTMANLQLKAGDGFFVISAAM